MAGEIWCRTCGKIVKHDERQNTGCGCDPDAPTWCCITDDGNTFGFSSAKWEELS